MRRFLRALCFTGGWAVLWALPSLCAASWLQTARLTDSGGAAGEGLGFPVAIDGDVAVVANIVTIPPPVQHRVVIVYVRSAGVWNQVASLIASDGVTDDAFGISVAIHGDTIAVGAPTLGSDSGTFAKQGTVYVYVRPAGGWSGTLTESAQLQAPSVNGIPVFLGRNVAFAGDNIAVCPSDVPIGLNTFAVARQVYVFNKPASGWSGTLGPSSTLTPATPFSGSLESMAASGSVVIAGAPFETVGSNSNEGKALVWVQPSTGWSGTLSSVAELIPSDGALDSYFGYGSAIDGTTVIMTGMSQNVAAKSYLFERPVAGWSGTVTESAQLVGSFQDNPYGSVNPAISGNNAVVVAPDQSEDGISVAYVFTRPASGWSGTLSESQKLEDPQSNTNSGILGFFYPAISGNTIVLGAPADTDGSNAFQGAAYVFDFFRPFETLTRFLIDGPIRVAPGVPVEFPVQVLAGARAPSEPTGEVLITDLLGQECRARLSGTGEGSCSLTFPRAGIDLVFARYEGNSEFAPSLSLPLIVIVTRPGAGR